ncbi:MAG: hybrid sensor histidine kinase/response regulator [Candidatus Viridilinea halotolerans]|uniref:histidine kinase n=1 Tax=Candidatus Viridilinea halotolerans TaxID=2491704 RepID=A0A426TRR3_9CHLR|nr:MAG: hybrid sensor histidine kinase/response regulator [Candidatus Viridilinea halotolerans]
MEQGTILIVDDNPQILSILTDLLRPLGHTIVCATDGAMALEMAQHSPPDLLLLDVMMPGMDGFTICRRVRADSQLAQMPVILITALDDRESRIHGFEAGADEFITKPFDYAELRARVSTVLQLNRYRKLNEQQERLAAERQRFAWAVEHSQDGILVLGPDDTIRYANPQARTFLGSDSIDATDVSFHALAASRFTFTPSEHWHDWPSSSPNEELPRFLVRPESRNVAERWLRVELLPPSSGDDARVVRLRDVTEQLTTQREMWTFHAMLGHKLRTPLVGILGGLNILSGGAKTMERDAILRIADVALASARRLRSEIEDILHYLRPPADIYGVDGSTAQDIAALSEQLATDLGAKAFALDSTLASGTQRLVLTRHSIEVVLREILENSVKFHPERAPSIQMILEATSDQQLLVQIIDDGTVLPPDQIDLAWRPYYQSERNFTGQIEGMGLGLALVARIIHAVGGRCSLNNRRDAAGVVVSLTVPFVAQPGTGGGPSSL